jgi:hypothetical protein
MLNKSRKNIFKVALLTLIFCLVSGCMFGVGGFADYEVQLPNKYKLIRSSREEVEVYSDFSSSDISLPKVIVGPKVTEINFTGDIVYGRVVKPSYEVSISHTPEGYFILNTKTNEAQVGLKRFDWLAKLKNLGINDPKLDDPSSLPHLKPAWMP